MTDRQLTTPVEASLRDGLIMKKITLLYFFLGGGGITVVRIHLAACNLCESSLPILSYPANFSLPPLTFNVSILLNLHHFYPFTLLPFKTLDNLTKLAYIFRLRVARVIWRLQILLAYVAFKIGQMITSQFCYNMIWLLLFICIHLSTKSSSSSKFNYNTPELL